jgi:predicted GIY-YIG superfamily endonuclease
MVFIYSLKLTTNKYYIGKTDSPNFRLQDHFDNSGSAWTKKYKPISIHQVIPDMKDHDEQRITQEYMNKYGIDNVRGGPWCKVVLSSEEKLFIKKLLHGENDKCYHCGSTEHFAKDCSMKQTKTKPTRDTCERCGRFGHSEKTCFAKTDVNGKKIIDREEILYWECEFCGKEFDTEKGCMFHENVHCTKRRGKNSYRNIKKQSRMLQDELYDSSDDDDIICYRCGRPGHKSTECYAQKHKKGYWLD